MFINNMDINIRRSNVATTHDGNIHVDFFYFILFKDYVTGLEVLALYAKTDKFCPQFSYNFEILPLKF